MQNMPFNAGKDWKVLTTWGKAARGRKRLVSIGLPERSLYIDAKDAVNMLFLSRFLQQQVKKMPKAHRHTRSG
jgi:hypothetical protein